MFRINRAYSSPKSILSIDAKLEEKEEKQSRKKYWSEVIFFKINHYKQKREINMLFSAHDLRALSIALEDLHATGQSNFKNYTAKDECKNTMTLGAEEGTFFINIERSCQNDQTFKIEHIFGSYSVRAFTQSLRLMADQIEKAVFAAQSGKGY